MHRSLTMFVLLAACSPRPPEGTCPATGSDDLAAALGDTECSTVALESGTYSGSFSFDHPVRLVGAGPENTVFDGGGDGPVLVLNGVGNSELEGIRVVNGANVDSDNASGGGLIGSGGGSLTLRNLWLDSNHAANGGAGAYIGQGYDDVVLEGVRIFDNTVEGLGVGAIGGGLWLDAPARVTFRDSEVADNLVRGNPIYQAAGGGLLVSCYMGATTPPAVIAENLSVRGNRVAPDALAEGQSVYGGGIAIDCPGSTLDFSGSIEQNSIQVPATGNGEASGAGLSLMTKDGLPVHAEVHDATVRANTVVGNSFTGTKPRGGGISVDCGWLSSVDASTFTLERTDVEENQVRGAAGGYGGGVAISCAQIDAAWTDSAFVGNQITGELPVESTGVDGRLAGGALWFSSDDGVTLSSALDLQRSTFTDNVVAGVRQAVEGGAVSISGVDALSVGSTTFSANRVEGPFVSGGAMHANLPAEGTVAITDSMFDDNHSTMIGAMGAVPTQAVGGGALALFSFVPPVTLPSGTGSPAAGGKASLERTRFDANTVTGAAGDTFSAHGGALLAVDVELTLRESTFAANRVEAMAGGFGGAVSRRCTALPGGPALITERVALIGNAASSGGGALHSSCAGVHTLRETTVVDNAVTPAEGAALTGVGGGGLRFSSDDGVTFSSDDGVTLVQAQNLTLARNTLDARVAERWGGQLYVATRGTGASQFLLTNSTLIGADDSNLGSVLGLVARDSSAIQMNFANSILAEGAFAGACSTAGTLSSTIQVRSSDRNWASSGCYTEGPPANDIVPGAAEVGQPLGTWLETTEGVPYFLPEVGSSVLDAVGAEHCDGLDGPLTVDAIGTPRTCPFDAGSIERP